MNEKNEEDADANCHVRKIEQLKLAGFDPFPAQRFSPSHTASDILALDEAGLGQGVEVSLAGRIRSIRSSGKLCFVDLYSAGTIIQLMINHSVCPDAAVILPLLRAGDFIGVHGSITRSKRGQLSINTSSLVVLGKSIIDLPLSRISKNRFQEFGGVSDTGILRRSRHLELLNNPEVRHRFIQRSHIVSSIRRFFDQRGFLEVDVPIITPYYGGAAARPFISHVNSVDQDWFLRISPELDLKRLLVGGFERVYCLGSNFRNEDIDKSHQPAFTMIEWYQAWSDYEEQLLLFEELVEKLAVDFCGSPIVPFRNKSVDFSRPWKRIRVIDAVASAIKIPAEEIERWASDDDGELAMKLLFEGNNLSWDVSIPFDWGMCVSILFEELAEEDLSWDPVFIMDHPQSISPLTKPHRDGKLLYSERFEPFAGGMEIGNAYSELNDPVLQRELLEGDTHHGYAVDQHFLDAMDAGMPQAGGVGLGVDRVIQILTNTPHIQDVILFPMTRRLDESK
jgi:lysyl-tRNA synthetase class 2